MRISGLHRRVATHGRGWSAFVNKFKSGVRIFVANLCFLVAFLPSPLAAEVLYAQDESLEMAFVGSINFQRKSVVLTDEIKDRVQKLARAKLNSSVTIYFEARNNDNVQGYVFFDSRLVRTQYQTTMTVLNSDGTVKKAVIVAFSEPQDYLPTDKWMDTLVKSGEAPAIYGSTLSVRSVASSVAVAKALFSEVLSPELNDSL